MIDGDSQLFLILSSDDDFDQGLFIGKIKEIFQSFDFDSFKNLTGTLNPFENKI